ncbi:GNAT family N-acetyltransferase [Salininema proteolyticum]|uniref:GNAT family N-acetyltransferase n=1 Tax=Salininema proteolyticum TaxID=1607685 RepID=A0ABV8TYF9_9ACTN
MTSEFTASSDRTLIDLDWVHHALSTDTYWATGRSRERVAESLANSECYGVYTPKGRQVAFGRLVTDKVAFAWLADVYVDREYRGRGLGKKLVGRIVADVEPWGLKRVLLATQDAQKLYGKFGFTDAADDPSTWMQYRPDRG